MKTKFWQKATGGLLAAAIVLAAFSGSLAWLPTAAAEVNYLKNAGFEETDGGAVPDYSPNEWNVTAGWYIAADPSACEGKNVLITLQNAAAAQTVSVPDGTYDFSGFFLVLQDGASVTAKLTSGENTASVTMRYGEERGRRAIEHFTVTGGSVTVELTATFGGATFASPVLCDDLRLRPCGENRLKNAGFEDTDGGTVPDYSPNEWNVTAGWYISSDPSACEGKNVLITLQNAAGAQTVSVPDGTYDFSGFFLVLQDGASVTATLTSGENTAAVTMRYGEERGRRTIERFTVTGGSVTVTLTATFGGATFASPVLCDDLRLELNDPAPAAQVKLTYAANDGTSTVWEQTVDSGTAVTVLANPFTYKKHTFTGWNTAADGSGTAYAAGDTLTVTDDMTLYAQWTDTVAPAPATVAFTPDTEPKGQETYNDSELNWYTDEIVRNGNDVLDGSRVFDFDESPTAGDWQKVENNFVRRDTDDGYAAALMFKIGHPLARRDYDIVYKDLQYPIKGGTLSYYLWLRNGLAMNHNVFATGAIVYDAKGNAYNLGTSDVLPWSGDQRYLTAPDDPGVAAMAGWYHYEAAMPKDVEIVRIGIMLSKTDPASKAVIGPSFTDAEGVYGEAGATFWPGEDWTPVDEISVKNTTVVRDGITVDDETLWTSDDAEVNPLGEYLEPWCMIDDKAIEIDAAFGGMAGDTVTVERRFDKGIKGGTLRFALYNCTNSYLDGQARYTVSVTGYDADGKAVALGDCTPYRYGLSYLPFSGLPHVMYVFNGYNYCSVDLPKDTVLSRIALTIRETTGTQVASALFLLDDVQYRGASFVDLPGGADDPGDPDTPDDPKTPDTPDAPKTGYPMAAVAAAAAAVPAAALAVRLTRKGKKDYAENR